MKPEETDRLVEDLYKHGILDKQLHPETREARWQPSQSFWTEAQKFAEQVVHDHPRTIPWRAVELGILQTIVARYSVRGSRGLTEDEITERCLVLQCWIPNLFSPKKRVKERKHE